MNGEETSLLFDGLLSICTNGFLFMREMAGFSFWKFLTQINLHRHADLSLIVFTQVFYASSLHHNVVKEIFSGHFLTH